MTYPNSSQLSHKSEVEILNSLEKPPVFFDCKKCKNKGVIYYEDDNGYLVCRRCECDKKRQIFMRIHESGLEKVFKKYTFEHFDTGKEEFKEYIYKKARSFLDNLLNDGEDTTFCMAGQSGAGKTHLCTAIVGQLIKHKGYDVRYFQWLVDAPIIKAAAATEEYNKKIKEFQEVKVLYIDDLFKTQNNAPLTAADVKLAFSIINYRYLNPDLITLISTEKKTDELIAIDQAIAGRILEMCHREYFIYIPEDISKNYRLKGVTSHF